MKASGTLVGLLEGDWDIGSSTDLGGVWSEETGRWGRTAVFHLLPSPFITVCFFSAM